VAQIMYTHVSKCKNNKTLKNGKGTKKTDMDGLESEIVGSSFSSASCQSQSLEWVTSLLWP
jgi:hypothetical protein